jgi:hypothetical protein
MKTFNDLRSRCTTGGLIKCRNSIPLAMLMAMEILYFQEREIKLIFLCNKSNKLPYLKA